MVRTPASESVQLRFPPQVPLASAAETNGAKSEIKRDVIAKIKIRRLVLSLIVFLRIGASFLINKSLPLQSLAGQLPQRGSLFVSFSLR